MRCLFIILSLLGSFEAHTKSGFEITQDHKDAYNLIIALRFEEGQKLISKIKEESPENVLVYHIENYIDFISIFISEEESEFRSKEKNKAFRLKKLQKGDPDDPYFLFSQAEVHLQWAMTRVKFQEYFTAAREVNKAIGLLEKNQKLFPDFISNKKSLSILHAVAGTIPDRYKSMVAFVSKFSGTIDQGLREINEVLDQTDDSYLFRQEAIAIKAMITLHLKNERREAWNYLSTSSLSSLDNPMATFLLASTALKCGENEEAIERLSRRTRSPRFFPFYYLELMLGSAKLSRLDADADIYLKSYINHFHGQDYFKDAYRKLAWHALAIKEDKDAYRFYMSMCEKEGSARIDEDKSALLEAERRIVPNVNLLRARLLFDGGYYAQALVFLENIDIKTLNDSQKLELSYRKGRVLQEQDRKREALVEFSKSLNNTGESRAYFGCASAYQLGVLYEGSNESQLALDMYKQCLRMNPDEYRNSLHQKAKAGINRLQ